MNVFNVLSLIGGLALFLFGMSIMGKALEKQAGKKLQKLMEKLTSSPIKGFFLGLAVTAIIQSSSATTVMVVGFVNSGIMKLTQAISIIMGSNVGTTVTAWVLSLTGIKGDSIFVSLLKPSSFTPILAFIGIIMYMAGKNRRRDTGTILLGFAVLMYGMEAMTSAMEPLANVPEFVQLFTVFSNPLLGVIMGAVLTGVIQSSSASVGILQALAYSGAVKYSAAIPIIMGQNIGTCITALISSVGTNKNARRAAMVHLYFNIIGTSVFLILYYVLNALFDFAFVNSTATPFGIAVVHSLFNVFATVVLLPFRKQLEKLACLTIRDDKLTEGVELLDERLLSTPAIAVDRARKLTITMANTAGQALFDAMDISRDFSKAKADSIMEAEEMVDKYEDQLGTYLVRLSSHSMSLRDSHQVSILLHTIGDFERISDHAVNILTTAREINEKNLAFSQDATKELDTLTLAVHEIVSKVINAFQENDIELARGVEPLEQVVDDLTRELKRRHIDRLRDGKCTIELGFILSDYLGNCERIADHCSNIAVALIEVEKDSFGTHQYLNLVKSSAEGEFSDNYKEYKSKYKLM